MLHLSIEQCGLPRGFQGPSNSCHTRFHGSFETLCVCLVQHEASLGQLGSHRER